ncbi:MAG: hypothetical protein J0G94_16840 [Sphingomonadales bacterium]|nr:hypothetical protein [Sphingomonadales bacterium]
MPDIMRLIDDHHAMEQLADRLVATARGDFAQAATCRALMAALAERVAGHLMREADFLRGDGQRARPEFAREVAAFTEAFGHFTESWLAYLGRWSGEGRIERDRARYAGETADIMTALKLRIARENDVVYPLALRTGRIVLA